MEVLPKREAKYIVPASTIASTISTLLINPLDVLKVRQQRIQSHTSSSPLTSAKLPNIMRQLHMICREEGAMTLMNGLKYSLYSAVISTVSYFYFYETITPSVRTHITQNRFAVPMLTAMISRILTTSITFPLEYFRTIQQSATGISNVQLNYTMPTKNSGIIDARVFSAYFVTLNRNVGFSVIYWGLVENIRESIHAINTQLGLSPKQESDPTTQTKRKSLAVNAISGSIAGALTAVATHPLDVVKTRRQLYEEYTKLSSWQVLRQIAKEEGIAGVFAGIRPRMLKVILACSSFISMYEYHFALLSTLY